MLSLLLLLGGLTDAEIDAIAAKHPWPGSEEMEKTRALITFRGTVPREAAAEVYAATMAKQGLAGASRQGHAWWNADLEVGAAALPEAAWSGSAPLGKDPDFTRPRREALRKIEAAAERQLLEWTRSATGGSEVSKLSEVAAEAASVRKAKSALATAEETCRAALRALPLEDEDAIASRLQDLRARVGAARGELAARRERLSSKITRREEVRLILLGVLE